MKTTFMMFFFLFVSYTRKKFQIEKKSLNADQNVILFRNYEK